MAYAVGTGVFQAGSAVFFTRVLGLSPTQVGLGLSVAAAVSLVCSVPLGALTDRFGAQWVWLAGRLVEAALLTAYPPSVCSGSAVNCRTCSPRPG